MRLEPFVKFLTVCLLSISIFLGSKNSNAQSYNVERVVDGDTIVLEQIGKARLIGVDTPEAVHPRKPVEYFAREASAYLNRKLQGKRVELRYEAALKDRWDRTLAYVYLDGVLINADIIRNGYGHAYTDFPFSMMEEFRKLETTARQKRLGMWAPDAIELERQKLERINTGRFACVKKTCSAISSCAEAMFLLNECGYHRLDGNKDGIPCEKICMR